MEWRGLTRCSVLSRHYWSAGRVCGSQIACVAHRSHKAPQLSQAEQTSLFKALQLCRGLKVGTGKAACTCQDQD